VLTAIGVADDEVGLLPHAPQIVANSAHVSARTGNLGQVAGMVAMAAEQNLCHTVSQ
jgi:hypothetical protein